MEQLIFGPVPSRRLGRSLGVNNIPYKVCTYSCIYCQVGKAVRLQHQRQAFYPPGVILKQLRKKLADHSVRDYPDYITLVPDGEPTLDIHFGELIEEFKKTGFPVAVITNGSLLTMGSVQDELMSADYISVKAGTVNPATWKHINKPHRIFDLTRILGAIKDFSQRYQGILVTESMLIKGKNDSKEELTLLAQFLNEIKPERAYLTIPTRPPAFLNTYPADELAVTLAYDIFTRSGLNAELLTGYEGNEFACSGNFSEDLLSITAVHPMRLDAVSELMARSGASSDELKTLVERGAITIVTYNGEQYCLRKF